MFEREGPATICPRRKRRRHNPFEAGCVGAPLINMILSPDMAAAVEGSGAVGGTGHDREVVAVSPRSRDRGAPQLIICKFPFSEANTGI